MHNVEVMSGFLTSADMFHLQNYSLDFNEICYWREGVGDPHFLYKNIL
jgi:hypothetical protein